MTEDRKLVERIVQGGDTSAYDALYASYADRLYRFVMRLTGGDRELADDVFQDTWVVAIRRLGTFEHRSAFFTWLGGIAFHKFRRHIGASRLAALEQDPVDPAATGRVDLRIDIEELLQQLPNGYRAVLVLHAEGFTHAEIGGLLGIAAGSSKSQLSRARSAALRLLGENHDR